MSEKLPEKKQKEQLVDVKTFSDEEKKRTQEVVKQIDITDSQALVTYGIQAQKDISTFSDNVLNKIRAKDIAYVGEILTNLVTKVKEVDVDHFSSGGFLSKVPILGSLIKNVKRFITRFDKVSTQIDKIVHARV